jgi:nucleoside-diphosphate-sugar epimerase
MSDRAEISPIVERGARILVTGASGFVGRAVVEVLSRAGYIVHGTGRGDPPSDWPNPAQTWFPIELSAASGWHEALAGVSAVVHLAARVHQMKERGPDKSRQYHQANVDGTLRLARCAAESGTRRFVFMSSIKVNGERTGVDTDGLFERFTEDSPPSPADPYGRSKWQAEQQLRSLCQASRMTFTILRPPLVYGPHVGANFLQLLKAVQRGYPLPFAGVRNLRSLMYVGNLAEAVLICLESSIAANKTYLVSDVDTSTPDLVLAIARTLSVPARLVRMPQGLLRIGGALTLKSAQIARLLDSLVIDDCRIRNELFWTAGPEPHD